MKNPLIAIVGPTASGKTELSIEIAKKFNGECINADSTQIFNGLSIATNKVTDLEKGIVPHHLLSILDLKNNTYSVKTFQQEARNCIFDIWDRHKLPILVGGTGLYINAVLKNYYFNDISAENILKLRTEYNRYTTEQLWEKLEKCIPIIDLKSIHKNNRQRVISTLIGLLLNYNNRNVKTNELFFKNPLIICLNPDRNDLKTKINSRINNLLSMGLIEEVQNAYKYCDHNLNYPSMKIIGVKEIVKYLKGEINLEECIQLMQYANYHYAKRQITWFKHQLPVNNWLDYNYSDWNTLVVPNAIKLINSYLTTG